MTRYIQTNSNDDAGPVGGYFYYVFNDVLITPGKPAEFILGDMATAEDIAIFNAENGLDKPFIIQVLNYTKLAVQGDLGISYTTKQP